MFNQCFVWLSGHSPAIASQTQPAEQLRLVALGMSLILPVSIGGLGGFATAWRMSEGNVIGAVITGAIVALFTLVVDRSLMASGNRSSLAVTLRLVLTILTSTVFAHSALLWLFADRIDAQAGASRQQELVQIASLFRPDSGQTSSRITTINGQIEPLTTELEQVNEALSKIGPELSRNRQAYADEVAGRGSSGEAGEGPESRRIMALLIKPMETELERQQSEKKRLATELAQSRSELAVAWKEQERDQNVLREQYQALSQDALNRQHRGILSQYLLLHEIIEEDHTALLAYLFLSLLLLFWELVPVLLKLTMETGEYDLLSKVSKAEMTANHAMRMKIMELEEIEATAWLKQAEERFRLVDEKRAAIPKRAHTEHREAYLQALKVLIDSLNRTGAKLGGMEQSGH